MPGRNVTRFVALVAAAVVVATGVPAASAAADTTPPALSAVSLTAGPLTPGATFSATVDASDDVAVTRVVVQVVEESTGQFRALESFSAGNRTVVSAPVTSTWANGTYRVWYVLLYDAAGNYSLYYADGTYRSSPPQGSSTHDIDLTTQQATVSGAAQLSPPVLSALTMKTAATNAGEPTTVAFAISPAGPAAQYVQLGWHNDDSGQDFGVVSAKAPGATGTIQTRLPTAGRWHLDSVLVVDARGNSASYGVDGQISRTGQAGAHDLDLAAVHVVLAPGRQDVRVVARPGRLTLVRTGQAADAKVLSGYRITVQPAGIVRDLSAAALSTGLLDLTPLPNGVTQVVTLMARSQWGNSPVASVSGRPVLSGNVTGVEDVTGDGRSDVIAMRQSGLSDQSRAILRYPGTGTGTIRAATAVPNGENWGCEGLAPGHLSWGGGAPLCQTDELVAIHKGGAEVLGSRGWRPMQWVDGGYSLNADRYPDVITMNTKGELLLYPRTSRGTLVAPTRIGTGWNAMISVISAGDLTGDRRNDIAAVDASGRLWLYPGNGNGGVTARRQIGSGWQNMAALLPLRDLSGDGKADLGGITPGGDLRLYRGTGTGGVRAGVVIGTGWQRYL